ncbi:hypothetical protein L6452_38223 [Arctium lappa]|uniref:Uncharacterized protein n=1 Tax=Arctium lappa TaxID=4217 RepID=A0ACB8Y6B8_ARCLA|nr:hypothetical protein L6452_38223 [Arctium lappa]
MMIDQHAIETRREIVVVKNDLRRIRAVCRGNIPELKEVGGSSKGKEVKASCPWVLHISPGKYDDTWMVKTYVETHKCLRSREVSACTTTFLSQQISDTLVANPDIPVKALQINLEQKYSIKVSKMKSFRAKQLALKKLTGDYVEQYSMLRDYILELQRTNPDTTVKLDVEIDLNPNNETRKFKRIYVCLGALKKGFMAGGRDLLGLDGSFMKGPFPGQVLTAVGIDSNHGIYPLAYAIVEAETTSSWTWFLECLGDDLDMYPNFNFTFISDRQKGIILAISKVFPCADHRYCLRHIHENMKQAWKGRVYKEHLWKCATSSTLPEFQQAMNNLRAFNVSAYEWLNKIPPHHWSRSHFTGRCHSDVLLNNMCEVFNRQLVDGRDKPIITTLEYIREYLMKRIVIVQNMIQKADGPLTPVATKMLDAIKTEATKYIAIWNGGDQYQVNGPWMDQCIVDVKNRVCSCRRWELSGMPCKHVVATIWNMAVNGINVGLPEKWVDNVYWLDTWKAMYAFKIFPTNGRRLWPKSVCTITLNPPTHHTQVGRPKKRRRKALDELAEKAVKATRT